ncbi:protein Jade-2-like [Arapaima gigas]
MGGRDHRRPPSLRRPFPPASSPRATKVNTATGSSVSPADTRRKAGEFFRSGVRSRSRGAGRVCGISNFTMESERKKRKYSSSSNDSDTTDSHVTSWSRSSKSMGTSNTWVRQGQKKPSEVFRTDFITAMKLPDSAPLSPEEFYVLSDPWRQEWEKGVQVPANVEAIPDPVVRVVPEVIHIPTQGQGTTDWGQGVARTPSEPLCRYDLDDLEVHWLDLINAEFREMAMPELDELTMERVMAELERQCEENTRLAIEAEEGLGIEYDEDVVCDVCRSPEGEDGNEMVFCDKCNVCVHQACYGILKVPQGSWLCRTCALGVQPKCLLCPKRGGALKPTRSGTKWVHVSCALWIPEVSIGCPEKMEPITKWSHIPASRWALCCSLCQELTGTCIQCSMPSCIVAFHVTCAFDHGLEMRTLLAENDEVRFKSYCAEHSTVRSSRSEQAGAERPSPTELEKAGQRKRKLQELEEEFYRLVDPRDVSDTLHLSEAHVDFIYQFWKLRRKANFNRPLLALKQDEVDNLAQQEQDVLYRRLKLFTHLRQDLERVRNLCYMVTRREKLKHSLCDLQENIFHLQVQILEQGSARERRLKRERGRQTSGKDAGKERQKGSPEKKESWRSENGSLLKQLGLSKSCPLDGTLFDGWLAQSVQIAAEDMPGHWSLGSEPHDRAAGLLSDQLLHGEENLLKLMMDPSVRSTWKTPQLGRRAKGKPRGRVCHTQTTPSAVGSQGDGVPLEGNGPSAGHPHSSKTSHRHRHRRHHRHLHPQLRTASGWPRRTAPQPPISKMISCHISEERRPDGGPATALPDLCVPSHGPAEGGPAAEVGQDRPCPERELPAHHSSAYEPGHDRHLPDRAQSDSDMRASGRRVRLAQLHSGNEEVLRRSILAS